MTKLSSLLPALLIGSGFVACGGISDPAKVGSGSNIATVTGALSADTAIPAGAHVAAVWRKGSDGGFAIAADAPIVDGKFTLNIAPPPDAYLMTSGSDSSGSETPPSVGVPSPTEDPGSGPPPPSGGGGAKSIKTMNVSGQITGSLKGALAGFVVYVDGNGNNALDLEGTHAGSPDTILGGNDELTLAYLTGGGALDYEKMRDKAGILPTAGFNLMWDDDRWVGLDLVELKISARTRFPSAVCSHSGGSGTPGSGGGPSGGALPLDPPPEDAGAPPASYPLPGDPDLSCSDDGSYFTYGHCMTPPPPPAGLCSDEADVAAPCFTEVTYRPDPIPSNWPCPDLVKPPPVDAGSP